MKKKILITTWLPAIVALFVLAALLWLALQDDSRAPGQARSTKSVASSAAAAREPVKSGAILKRAKERLEEVDRREMRTAAAPSQAREKALQALRGEIPGVQVDFDVITGAPKHIMAAGKFLARGKREAKNPHETVREFIARHEALFGHDAAALSQGRARVTREDVTAHNGMRTVVWQQEVAGVPVFETILKANLTKEDDLITVGSHFMQDAAKAAGGKAALVANPPLSAPKALVEAAASLGGALDAAKVTRKEAPRGVEQAQKLAAPGFTDTTAHLAWVPMDESTLRLAWQIETFSLQDNEMFRLLVDVEDGKLLLRQSLTADISNATYRIFTSDSPSPFTPGHNTPSSTQPSEVARTLLTTQAYNTTASPEGWIPDGQNETVGNNVDAHLDLNADNVPDTPRPQGSPSRVFDPAFNSASEPTTYRDASVTQLFYYNNWIHDRMYELGFTESAGNFQTNNFGRGGNGNDAVQADAQDGSGTNNANFSTPSDGSPGRMQMYIWPGATPDRDSSFDGDIVVHEYGHGISNRLVGGGVGISAWQSRGMGEGWSDFYAMSLLSEASDNVNGVYAMGGYSTYQLSGMTTNYYFGIRRYPYCTDMAKAPLTYRDIDPTQARPHTGIPLSPRYSSSNADPSQYHAQGEVWCNMLMECRANIINHHGWAVGNELMLRIVTDGLKLTPANPTFIQARDAIIQADLVNNGGANAMRLWSGFAKRGIGAGASGPANSTTTGVVESYELPDDLSVTPFDTLASTGVIGGPFSPSSRVFTLQNTGSAALNWTAATNQPWMVLSRGSGSLAAAASDVVTLTIGPAANSLAVGSYSGTVTFTNTVSGAAIQRQVSLVIDPLFVTIFSEPFNSPTLGSAWTVTGTGPFRTQVTALNAPRSSNHLTMDSSADGTYARNEATLTVNLAGLTGLELQFWAKGFGEEANGPPASPFINGADFDGVAMSADGGTTWWEIQPLRGLTSTWMKYVVDLDAAIAARGISYTSNFKLRFNQYDNYGISTDGIAIDDILIGQPVNNTLALSLPAGAVTEGAAALTATLSVSPAQTSAMDVTLTSSNGEVTVPATVSVPAGTTEVTFPVTIVDDALLDGSQPNTITAEAPTFNPGSVSLTVHDNETTTITVDAPLNGIEGSSSLSATVSTGTAVGAPVTVALESSNVEASVPASVIIPAGQSSTQFFITLANDPFINGSRSATFIASVTGWTPGSDSMTILDDENADLVLALTIPAIAETDGLRAGAGRVSINGLRQSDLVISLASGDAGELTAPASVTIPAGATQAFFDLTAVNDAATDGPQSVVLTASAAGFTDGTLTVIVHDDEAAPVAWNPRPAHLSTSNPVTTDLTWNVSEGNLIVNGDFESGLSGWSTSPPGGPMFRLQNGLFDPSGNDTPTPPYAGGASMIFAPGSSTGMWTMWQDVAVPPDGPAPVLQWVQRIRNTATAFTSSQQFRLEVRDPATDAVLATPYVTAPGSPLFQDWAARTADLSAWRGRSVRIAFVLLPGSGILNVLLDEIKLRQRTEGSTYDVYFGTNPVPGAAELLGNTSSVSWALPNLALGTTYYWQVVTKNGAQVLPGPVWQFSVPAAGSVASFAWSAISSPQLSGSDIPVTVTALDALGNTASGFSGTADLQAVLPPVTQPSVLITEFSTWTTDEVEFTNVTSASVDVSGWKVLVPQFNSFPAPYLTVTIPNGTSVPAGGVFRVMESGTSPGAYPLFRTGLSWNMAPSIAGYVVLQNARGEVMDFVCVGGDPRLVTVPLPPEAWAGSALPAINSNPASQSYQRIGSRDNNNASDWQFLVATPGVVNTGLTLPLLPGPAAPAVAPVATAAFSAGVWSGNVRVLGAAENLRMRAAESGGRSGESGQFLVIVPGGQLALTAGASASEGSGTLAGFGTVTLPAPAASPVTVSFILSPASQASAAAVTIPAGATSGSFDLSIVDDAIVEGAHTVAIVASAAGYAASGTHTVTIADNEGTMLSVAAPASATEGQGTLASAVTITSSSAPVNAVTITLTSSDTTEATVPATVTLPAGQTSVTASLAVVNDTLLDGAQNVTLTASSPGFASGTASVTVNDNEPATITLAAPSVVLENAGTLPSAGTVTLGGVAPADVVVALASSHTGSLAVPATVTVPAGQGSAAFAITAVDDSVAEANVNATLTATSAGLADGNAAVTVRDDDLAAFAFGNVASPQKAAAPFAVTISARNSSDEVITGFTGTAALGAPGNAITPAVTAAFSGGAWTGNVTLASASASQTVTAASGAAAGASNSFAVDAGTVASFALSAVPSPQAANVPFTLTATAKDALNQDLAAYAGPARLMQIGVPQYAQVGPVSSSNTSTAPLLTSGYNRGRTVILVTAADLGGARQMTSMGLRVLSPPPALDRFVIRVKPTALTTLVTTASWDNSGWQTVHDAPLDITSTGWTDFAFSSPFFHNGTSNLLIEVIFSHSANMLWSPSLMSSTVSGRVIYASVSSSSTANADPALWTGTSPSKTSTSGLPVMRFGSRTLRDASPSVLASFTGGAFSGPVSAPYSGTGQALGVWDVAAGVLSITNDFTVTSAGTLAVAFSGSAAEGGTAATGTVTASVAPVADLTVNLSAVDAAEVNLPASVTILAGTTTATFTVSAVDDSVIEAAETVTVTAAGAGYDSGSRTLTVADNDSATLAVTLPASVTEGGATATGTVTASAAATFPVTVTLAATPAGLVTLPVSVTLPAGQTSATFSISAVNNTIIDGTRAATISASATGWTGGSATLDVLDNETTALTVNLASTTPREGAGTVSGTVALSGTMPSALTVSLSSDDTSEATVPATVTISSGTSSAAFTLTVVDDALTDGTQPVILTATAPGFTQGTRSLQVLDNDVAGFVFTAIPSPQVRNAPFATTINAADVNGATITTFTGTAALSAAGAGGAVTMTPAATGAFVNGTWTGSASITQADSSVVITADGGGGITGASNSFNVQGAAALSQFGVTGLSSPQVAGTPVPVTVTARDAAGNTITGYTGTVSFTATGPSSADVVAGTGTSTTTNLLASSVHDSRNQAIFSASEVGAARTLRSLAIDVSTLPGQVLNAFTIRLKHTSKLDYTAAGANVFETTGWTTVYQANQTITSGWNTFVFQNGFAFNGTDNLMVDISFNNTAATTSGTVRYATTSSARTLTATSNSTDGDPLLWNGSVGPFPTSTTSRFNARFSGFVPVTVTPAASGAFVGGVWTGDVTFSSSGTGVVLRVVNGAGIQGQSPPFTLNGNVLDHFDFAAIATPQAVGAAVPVTITAKDANDQPVPGFAGTAAIAGEEQPLKAQTGSGTSTWSIPLGSQSRTQRMQVIYTAAEAGGTARTLTGLDLNPTTAPGSTLTNFTIRMKHTTKADFTAAGTAVWESAGWTTVFQGDVTIPEAGWRSFPFTTPFAFDGARNLMVDFSYNNASTGAVQGLVRYTAAAANRTVLRQTDLDEGDPLLWNEWTSPAPVANTVVPNARFASGGAASVSPTVTGAFTSGTWSGTVVTGEPMPRVLLSATAAGRTGTSNPVTISPAGTLTLTLATSTTEGATPLAAQVVRSGDTAAALTVSLASSDTSEAAVSAATVTIPAGDTAAPFLVNVQDDALADGAQTAIITATAAGYTTASSSLAVADNEALALEVSLPPNLSEATIAPGAGIVRINQPAPSDLTVALSSNDTSELTVPASVTIVAGAISAPFTISVLNDTLLDGPQTVTVGATAAGCAPGAATTIVQDNESLNLTISPGFVVENAAPVSATVTMSGTLPSPVTVTISINDSTELLVAPDTASPGAVSATVTIPANALSATFALLPQDDGEKDGNQSVTLALNAAGFPDQTRFVNVVDDELDRYFMSFIGSPQTANAGIAANVFAQNISGSTISTNSSTLNLTAAGSAGAVAMSPASVTLSNGTGSFTALFTAGASGVSITATDSLGTSVRSSVFDVLGAGGLSRFAWSTVATPQLVGSPIPVTVTAKDAANNTLSSYTGPADLKAFTTTADTIIGTGTTSWTTPLGILGYSRTQGIYLASELGAAKRLTGLALNILTSSPTVLNNFTIRLKHTSSTSFATASWEGAGWITVFSGSRSYNTTGWLNTVFTRPFDYDGTSNLMVDISYANSATGTAAACQASTTASARSVALNTSSSSSGLPATWSGTSPFGSTSTNLLNVRFTNAAPWTITSTGSSQVTVGSGTGTSSFPLGTYFHDERTQMIYTAAEMGGAMNISSVALDVSTIPGQVMNAFTIRMKHTAVADYSTSPAWESTGWTTVYATAQTISATGWNTFTLSTPFAYNGTSNLMVDISFNNSSYTSDGYCRTSTTSTPRAIYYYTDSGYGDPLAWSGTTSPTPYTSTSLPNMRFSGTGTVSSPAISPVTTGSFASGVWSGNLSALKNGSSVFFATDDPVTGIAGYSNAITINQSGTMTLAFLGTLAEGQGTVANGGTLTLSAAPASNVVVSLASASTANLSVPATVTVPAGQTSAAVPVTIMDDSLIEGAHTVAVTASAPGYPAVTTSAGLADNDGGVLTLTTPATVMEGAGSFTATLGASVSAPVPLTISLASNDTSELTVPATVTLPANALSVNFTVTIVNDTLTDGSQSAVLTASVPSWTSGMATVIVTDNDAPPSLDAQTSSGTVTEGGTTTGYVYIPSALGTALTVTLASDDTSIVTVPATVTISAGSTSASFTVTAPENTISTGTRGALVSASASGYRPDAFSIGVLDNDASGYRVNDIAGTPVAGTPVSVTITAIAADGSTVTAHTGTVNLAAAGSTGAVTVTPAVSGAFSSGVWTGNVIFGQVATGVVLTATDALGRTGSSNPFNTTFGALDHFTWDAVPSPQVAATPFTATVTAKDIYENTVAAFTGTAALSALKSGAETVSGTGTSSNSTMLTGSYDDARSTFIYLPSQVGGAQMIGAISFNVTSASATAFTNFTVRMKHTSRASYSTSVTWDASGWSTVYRGAPVFGTTGWTKLVLSAPFAYNGAENLMLDVSWDRSTSGTGATVQATTTSPAQDIYAGVYNFWGYGNPISWTGSSPSASTSSSLPNVRFEKADAIVVLPMTSGAFVGGTWSGPVSVLQIGTSVRLMADGNGVRGASGAFSVTSSGTLALTMASTAMEGAAPLTATLSIGSAPASDLVVALSSSNSGAATVPATVTIPGGQTSVTFPVTIVDDALLDGTQSTIVTAVVAGLDSGVAALDVTDDETTTISLTLPASLAENASAGAGTVTLGAATGAPVTLPLSSSDLTELSVPASVTILAGATSATFPVTPVDDAVIDLAKTVTVSTSMAGWTGGSANMQITDNESNLPTLSFTSSVSETQGTLSASLFVDAALESSTVFTLASADVTEAAVPATATINAGATSTTFSISILNDTDKDGSQTFAITAAAPGFTTATRNLTVTDNDVHNFLVSAVSSPQVRNAPFNVTFTARDVNNLTITNYTGAPALSAADGATALSITPASLSGFSSGVKTQAVTIGTFATSAIITVTDASAGASGSSNAFVVGTGSHTKFAWSTISTPQTAGTAFPATITAQDSAGNTVTGFSGTAALSIPAIVGVGTAATTWSVPLGTFYDDARTQVIYTSAEVGAAKTINSLALNVTVLPGQVMNAFTIRMRHTTKADYSGTGNAAWESTNWTTCYQANQTISSTGWNTFNFTTPFAYDGTSNVMVDICFNNSSWSSSGVVAATTGAATRAIYYQTWSGYGDPLTWTGTSSPTPFTSTTIPDVRFGYVSAATISPATTGAFSAGVWTGNLTVPTPASNIQAQATSGSITGLSNVFSVNAALSLAVSLPSSALESAGTVTGTVTLSSAQASATTVTLASSDTTEAGPASSTVVIAAGATSANFTLNIINDTLADGAQTATISATAPGAIGGSANISVTDDDPSYFTFATVTSPKYSGGSFSVTINARTIDNQPATAFNGSTAALSATVGGTAATMTPAATGVFSAGSWTGNVSVVGGGSATLTATSGGVTGTSNAFTLVMPAFSVSLPSSAAEPSGSVSGTVTLSAALATATTVDLASSDTTEAVPATATVVIAAGATAANFTLNIINDTIKDGAQPAIITASSAGYTSGSATISVLDDEVNSFLVSVVGATQVRNTPFNVTFTARSIDNQTITTYAGSPVLSGLDGAASLSVSPGVVSGFTSGARTVAVTVADYASSAVLTLADTAASASGSSNAFAVTYGGAASLAWSTVPSPQVAAVPFPVTITAKDAAGNTVSSFVGTVGLSASIGSGPATRDVGSGSTTSSLPLNTIFSKCRTQQVHLASEIGGSATITSLAFNISAAYSVSVTDFTIRLKHTTRTGYSGTADFIWESSGFTTVYQGSPSFSTTGYVTFTFTTPFTYDGTSNLMVDMSYRASSTTAGRPTIVCTTRSGTRSINYYTSASTYGEPLTWSGTTPAAFSDSRTTDLRLGVITTINLTPSVTTAFSGGVWSGNVALASPAVGVVLSAASDALAGTSNSFEVVGAPLALAAEPAFTGGTSNTVAWNQPATGLEFELQRATAPGFDSPVSTGFLTAVSSVQSGLLNGQAYHYRVRMRRTGAAPWTSGWSSAVTSTQDATAPSVAASGFSTSGAAGTLAGTASDGTSGIGGVTVAGTSATTSDSFASWTAPVSGLVNGSNSITVIASDNAVPPNTATITTIVYRVITPAADSDGDGISDLLEHAFAIPALEPNPRAMLPVASVQTDGGSGQRFLTLDYRRRIQRAGLVYAVETSADMAAWTAVAGDVVEQSVTPVGDGFTETVRVRITPALDATDAKFVRLKVTVQ